MKPLTLDTASVRGFLAGTKTQHRVPVVPQPEHIEWFAHQNGWCGRFPPNGYRMVPCPFGAVGDVVYVRESYHVLDMRPNVALSDRPYQPSGPCPVAVTYAADEENPDASYRDITIQPDQWRERFDNDHIRWSSPATMPKWASRLSLKLVAVRVQKVAEISAADAKAEGIDGEAALICTMGCGHRDEEGDHLQRWDEDGDYGFLCPRCGERIWHHPLDECHVEAFRDYWTKRYPKHPFATAWCWCGEFRLEGE
jgi:hypothetical protein